MSLAASRPEGNRITNYEEYERNVKATDRQSLPSARHRRSMLEGVVDLTDTVDTDVTVQQLPGEPPPACFAHGLITLGNVPSSEILCFTYLPNPLSIVWISTRALTHIHLAQP